MIHDSGVSAYVNVIVVPSTLVYLSVLRNQSTFGQKMKTFVKQCYGYTLSSTGSRTCLTSFLSDSLSPLALLLEFVSHKEESEPEAWLVKKEFTGIRKTIIKFLLKIRHYMKDSRIRKI